MRLIGLLADVASGAMDAASLRIRLRALGAYAPSISALQDVLGSSRSAVSYAYGSRRERSVIDEAGGKPFAPYASLVEQSSRTPATRLVKMRQHTPNAVVFGRVPL